LKLLVIVIIKVIIAIIKVTIVISSHITLRGRSIIACTGALNSSILLSGNVGDAVLIALIADVSQHRPIAAVVIVIPVTIIVVTIIISNTRMHESENEHGQKGNEEQDSFAVDEMHGLKQRLW
jgi:hypothetical protein